MPVNTEVCAKTYSWVVGPWQATVPPAAPVSEGYAAEEEKGFFAKYWYIIVIIIILGLIAAYLIAHNKSEPLITA